MSGTWTVFRRELADYFNQPVAYVVITAYLLICGWFFASGLFLGGQAEVRGFLGVAPLILVFFTPALSMRLLAEEWRQGTMELLLTLPLRDVEVVIGKYLAVFTVFLVAQVLTLVYPLTAALLGPLDVGRTASGYLGLTLLGAAFLAVGMWASALTRSQVVAFIIGFFICFALFMLGQTLPLMPGPLRPLMGFVAVDTHFANMAKGVVDSRDVLYFASIILMGLAGAASALKGRRWGI